MRSSLLWLAMESRRLVDDSMELEGDMRGWCGDWTYVFTLMAEDRGLKTNPCWGQVGPDSLDTHYWIECFGWLVDGTGDQFDGFPMDHRIQPVMVVPHGSMKGVYHRKGGLTIHDVNLLGERSEWLQRFAAWRIGQLNDFEKRVHRLHGR